MFLLVNTLNCLRIEQTSALASMCGLTEFFGINIAQNIPEVVCVFLLSQIELLSQFCASCYANTIRVHVFLIE